MSFPSPGSRITFELRATPGFDRYLASLARRLDRTPGEAILAGLQLLQAALDARDEGRSLVVVDDAANTEEDLTDLFSPTPGDPEP